MSKRFVLFFLLCANAFAYAQSSDGTFRGSMLPDTALTRWSVGLFGGMTKNHHVINTLYATDMKYTDLGGSTAGVTASFHLKGWFSLRTDLALVQKNYRLDRDNRHLPFAFTESTNNYLSVPVTAVISLGRTFRVCGIVGAYAGYWLSGHREGQSLSVTYLVTGNQEDTFFDEDYSFNDVRDNRFDAGLVYGAALRCALFKKIDLSAELHWYYGLTDVQKNYQRNLNPRYNTTRALQFGISYWF